VHTKLIEAIDARLKELRGEIKKLEGARQSLASDGHRGRGGTRRRTRPRAASQPRNGRARPRGGRRPRQTRMDQRERQAQALNRIREHGSEGVTITALAAEMGVTRSYLYGRILPPLAAEITKPKRGVVAPKT
jgi:hypothetical protein